MQSRKLGPEWVIAGADGAVRKRSESHERLLDAARIAWPNALSYARVVGVADCECLATEVWEELLRSVLRTMRRRGHLQHVADLEAYLIGAFRHRFQRALLKERHYREKFLLAESVEKLESLGRIRHWKPVERLEHDLQVHQRRVESRPEKTGGYESK